MNWTPFHFDGNLWFGEVNTPEDWQDVLKTYEEGWHESEEQLRHDLLNKVRRGPDLPSYMPRFGLYTEYTGQTLGEWAESVDMKL